MSGTGASTRPAALRPAHCGKDEPVIDAPLSSPIAAAQEACRREFGPPEITTRGPGRVNLIGEHTDYNDGFVFPAAIDREVAVAMRRRDDLKVQLASETFTQTDRFSLDAFERLSPGPGVPTWSNYVRGVVRILLDAGYPVKGFEAAISGNVPEGAGLSSSAAFEVAVLTALNALYELNIPPKELALLAQRAENQFVGVACGIMDPFISAMGQRDHALLIDCRSLETRAVPLRLAERGVAIAILDSGVRRGLVDSKFNARREECETAVRHLRRLLGRDSIRALRDVNPIEFNAVARELPDDIRARARHVISENERVVRGVDALEEGNLAVFGKLMNQSHQSLKDDFNVSIPQLDLLASLAQKTPGVLGARMTGAGFGGCTVNLVEVKALAAFRDTVLASYRERAGMDAKLWVCDAVDGASVIS
ncbi:Galactokinase [compost metagenome]